jgi:tetratricopeptide (TPR) repeat protein
MDVSIISRILGGWKSSQYSRGIEHFNRREYAQAIDSFRELLERDRDPSNPEVELARFYSAEAHSQLGLERFQAGDLSGAEAEFLKAVQVEGSYPDLYYYLGVLAARQERLDEAGFFLDRALDLNPGFPEALAARALRRVRLGEAAPAAEDLGRLAALPVPLPVSPRFQPRPAPVQHTLPDLGGETDPHLARALEHADQGRPFHALEALGRAIESHPDYPDLHWRRGLILADLNRREAAVAAFDRGLALHPEFVEAQIARGLCLLGMGRPEEARDGLLKAAAARPGYADVAYLEGLARFRSGDIAGAGQALDRAIGINPRFWRARFVRGQVFLCEGDRARGETEIREALDHQPILFTDRSSAPGCFERGGPGNALTYLLNAVDCHPDYPDLRLQLGRLYLEADEVDRAREEFEAALAINPGFGMAHCHLGWIHLRDGTPGDAVGHFLRAAELQPERADMWCLLGEARFQAEDFGGSETAFNRALTLNPSYVDAMLGVAAVKRRVEALDTGVGHRG